MGSGILNYLCLANETRSFLRPFTKFFYPSNSSNKLLLHGLQECSNYWNGPLELLKLLLEWHVKAIIIPLWIPCGIPPTSHHFLHQIHHLSPNTILQVPLLPPVYPRYCWTWVYHNSRTLDWNASLPVYSFFHALKTFQILFGSENYP